MFSTEHTQHCENFMKEFLLIKSGLKAFQIGLKLDKYNL